MANNRIREEKDCLNCGTIVEDIFCPKCGQKNTQSRRSFYALFVDFFSGFINYDNSFWHTTRSLFCSPGKLSIEYMAGKRKTYLPPVQLYLLASFIAFFLPGIVPSPENNSSQSFITITGVNEEDRGEMIEGYGMIYSVEELDSLNRIMPKEKRIRNFDYLSTWFTLKIEEKALKNPNYNYEKSTFIADYFPKVLFLYMPIFAFSLWLFHNKRKWYYFDSGIFTLHFFSFFLLAITFGIISYTILEEWFNWEDAADILFFIVLLYTIFYFFKAHRNYYGESRKKSNLKAVGLFFINTILMMVLFVSFFLIAIII